MKEMESKKRILEEAVDSLNEEIAKLKAKGNGHYLFESCLFSLALTSILVRGMSEIRPAIVTLMKSLLRVFMIDT